MGYRWFESIFLQERVHCELGLPGHIGCRAMIPRQAAWARTLVPSTVTDPPLISHRHQAEQLGDPLQSDRGTWTRQSRMPGPAHFRTPSSSASRPSRRSATARCPRRRARNRARLTTAYRRLIVDNCDRLDLDHRVGIGQAADLDRRRGRRRRAEIPHPHVGVLGELLGRAPL